MAGKQDSKTFSPYFLPPPKDPFTEGELGASKEIQADVIIKKELERAPVPLYRQFNIPPPEEPFSNESALDSLSRSSVSQDTIVDRAQFKSGGFQHLKTGWALFPDGSAEFQNITLTGKLITLSSTQASRISTAIADIQTAGGGTLFLGAGVWDLSLYSITPVSNLTIMGVSPSSTILNFGSTAKNLSFTGSAVYTTGTITSFSGNTVTGSGTSWLTNATAGQSIFIGTRWYTIAAVTGNTTLITQEAYADNVTFPGSAYRIATILKNFTLTNVAVTGSTGTGIAITDMRQSQFKNVVAYANAKGMVLTNISEVANDLFIAVGNTGNGVEVTNAGLCDWESINLYGNGGHGGALTNLKDFLFWPTIAGGNTSDGFNITSCSNVEMLVDASGNGGQGIELVSGNDEINFLNPRCVGNVSDGIKLTATSDNCRITGGKFQANGGYGINIAASTCDFTNIVANTFVSNATAAANDGGTSTVIRGNNGLTDNAQYSLIAGGGFTGDGSDGALTISSGTTTIDLASASLVVKNYTSINITGTGKLAFINPASAGTFIILKSQGDVVLTSSTVPCVDASGLGGAGGTGGTGTTGAGPAGSGTGGTTGQLVLDDLTTHGGNAGTGGTGAGSAGGTGGAIMTNLFLYTTSDVRLQRGFIGLACGNGGGGGGGAMGTPSTNGGAGGRGGGALQINCGGALNFTGTVSVAGAVGVAGGTATGTTTNLAAGGGGGGGSGGYCVILYKTLTANSGTIDSSGGTGGAGGSCTDGAGTTGGNTQQSGAGGGGAGSTAGVGGAGAAGDVTTTNNGNNGNAAAFSRAGGGGGSGAAATHNSTTTTTGGTGGAGGTSGGGVVVKNTIFA